MSCRIEMYRVWSRLQTLLLTILSRIMTFCDSYEIGAYRERIYRISFKYICSNTSTRYIVYKSYSNCAFWYTIFLGLLICFFFSTQKLTIYKSFSKYAYKRRIFFFSRIPVFTLSNNIMYLQSSKQCTKDNSQNMHLSNTFENIYKKKHYYTLQEYFIINER